MKEKKQPLVSIVTGTFNSGKTLGKTIESVLGQSYPNIEYIIADAESNDNTIEIAESYRKCFDSKGINFTVLCGKDTGMYAGMNKGISVAKGVIIGIVNSDDYYEPDIVKTVVQLYKKTHFDLFYADLNIVDDAGNLVRVKKSKRMEKYFTTRYWNHPTTFIPSSIYQIRKYDESFQYYGDWDLILWIFKNYNNVVVVNKSLSNYRLGGKTTHQGFDTLKKKFYERRRGYKNNGYSPFYFFECIFLDLGKEVVMRLLKYRK